MRKMNLAQRLGDIARRKALEDDKDDQFSDSDDEPMDDYRPPVASIPSRSFSNNLRYERPMVSLTNFVSKNTLNQLVAWACKTVK